VTKQPFLTGFPRAVVATAKRRLQAAIRGQRAAVLRDSLCGYALMFARFLPASFLARIDPTPRHRHFGQVPVFWAWLAQILESNASCSKAVSLIQAWSRAAGLTVPSGRTGGYCQARGRIRLEFLRTVHERILGTLASSVRASDLWHGHVVKAIDGTSFQLLDTQPNQRDYPQPGGQKAGCGFPTMGVVGVLNLSHGGWEGFETCPHTAHDSAVAPRLLKHVESGDILLGDRAFCSYELIVRLRLRGVHAVMRLHQSRHRKLDWRKGDKLGANERLVIWEKPRYQPAGSTLDPEAWKALPETLALRYIRLGYEDRNGCKRMLVVATTLLDPVEYEAHKVADLYARRWDIELKLRDLKTTLGMERLGVRTPGMAHRTLWMMVIAHNLLRGLMQRAAIEANRPLVHMSFKGVMDHAVASHESYLVHRHHPRRLTAHHAEVIETCGGKTIDPRPGRREPRALKRRPKNYPLLTSPRGEFQSTPHRGRPRSGR
jgi:hypothetical protein